MSAPTHQGTRAERAQERKEGEDALASALLGGTLPPKARHLFDHPGRPADAKAKDERRAARRQRATWRTIGSPRARETWVAVAIGVLALVTALINLSGAPGYAEDEGTYTAQAFSIFDGRLAPYTYWYDHPPLGWILIAPFAWLAETIDLGDGTALGAARHTSALAFAVSSALIYLLARRIGLGRWFGLAAAGLFILSPLSLTFGRQLYLDTVALPFLLTAFLLALSPGRRLWPHIGAGIAFAAAVLMKETLALAGPGLLFALLNRKAWANRTFSVIGFLCLGGLVLAFYPLMAILRGELLAGPGHVSLQDALEYQLLERTGSGSVWQAGSGRQELVIGWIATDPVLPILGVVGALIALAVRRTQWIAATLAVMLVPVVVGSGYMPGMYIVAFLPFLALGAAAGLHTLWGMAAASRLVSRFASPAAATAVIRSALAIVLVGTFAVVAAPRWGQAMVTTMSQDANRDWRAALEWVKHNVPKQQTVLVPYTMWEDVSSARNAGPWEVIVLEKVDLDSEFEEHHPQGWQAVDWVVVGPTVRDNIENLNLNKAAQIVRNSTAEASFGDWTVRKVTH